MAQDGRAGSLYIVATPIGNLEDISQRALTILREVQLIVAEDTRHSQRLLQHYGIQIELQSLHDHNERQRVPAVIERLLAGDNVALISDAGTPLLSDPGYLLVRAACDNNIKVSPVPGPSAVTAALSAAGFPLQRFTFIGFLPPKQGARRAALQDLQHESGVVVLFESTHRILELLQDICAVIGIERPLVLARELTKLHENFLRGNAQELLARLQTDADQCRGEFVVLLAPAGERPDTAEVSAERSLRILLTELPLNQAVRLAAEISGAKRNRLYELALHINQEEQAKSESGVDQA
ncbi:MAG TPA: 16S rRNA (cytidine(1402)-2'-O)-methyltransferase [Gammaproteobacteria bacterium]